MPHDISREPEPKGEGLDNLSHPDAPDLTDKLDKKRIFRTGSFGVVYRCHYTTQDMEVAVKAIVLPSALESDAAEKDVFVRKVKRELGLWRRLKHPNIVPFLGIANGDVFASDYPCIVSLLMTNGTLMDYVEKSGATLSLPDRVKLIKGSVSGLHYLHEQKIVHGDFHPGNILIDCDHRPCLTDFGLSQTMCPMSDQLAYLYTKSARSGAANWAAPELLYPEQYPKLKFEATLQSDVYSLGSIILFILSRKYPWKDRGEAERGLKDFQNPPRPTWPINIPDGIWEFIELCWSPRKPENRPSAKEMLSFCTDKLEQLLRPDPTSGINVVLFGPAGSGKSSIINLLSGETVVQVSSSNNSPCTKKPACFQVPIAETQLRLWDTMGFSPTDEGSATQLLPYEHAHAVLKNLPDGANLILLCADKDEVSPYFSQLFWLINQFFYGGRAPMALVATGSDMSPDEKWWDCIKDDVSKRTSISIGSIPRVCASTDPAGCNQSRDALRLLLETHGTAFAPIPVRPDFSSYSGAASELATHCGLPSSAAVELVEKFSRPWHSFNVVLFGETETGMGSIIDLIGNPSPRARIRDSGPYTISTGMKQLHIWEAKVEFDQAFVDQNAYVEAMENSRQLIRKLTGEGGVGVDLVVFCKRFAEEVSQADSLTCKLVGDICEGQFPIAVVVAYFASQLSTEQWWEKNGQGLIKTIGRDVIGHACIPPLPRHESHGIQPDKRLADSRLSIHAMLEDCVSSRINRPTAGKKVEGFWAKLSPWMWR